MITTRFVVPVIFISVFSFMLPMKMARADYLVRPVPVQFVECVECAPAPRPYIRHPHKKHHVTHRHHRYHRCYAPRCGYSRISTACPHDFVVFEGGPAPARGRWINTDSYDNYDPDMSTGDDDPTVYPGMDIDN